MPLSEWTVRQTLGPLIVQASTNPCRERRVAMTLRDAWETEARSWIAWARKPGHDSYWRFHRDRFLLLLPPAPRRTLDVGCGEGRLPRDLKARGYRVIAIDGSATLVEHAREADPDGDYRIADSASLPLPDGSVELVTAFMSLHDMDDLNGAIKEAARVLHANGHVWDHGCSRSRAICTGASAVTRSWRNYLLQNC
jgi:ubiquinone/menaquinone biosynthesis C-methylase UbiE